MLAQLTQLRSLIVTRFLPLTFAACVTLASVTWFLFSSMVSCCLSGAAPGLRGCCGV